MKEISPLSVYIHCHGHLLNLAVKDTLFCVKILKDSLGTVQSLYNFIEASPKRQAIYMKVENNAESGFIRVLKSQSVTRWTCHYEAVRAVSEEFERVILCLNHIENDETSDSKTTSQAALLLNILDFEFVFGVELLNVILIQTSKLSSYLQSKKVDIRTARLQADLVIKVLEMMRGEDEFNRLFEKTEKIIKTTEDLLKQKEIDYEIRPAKISRRSKFSGDIKQFYRVTNYYEGLDKLVKELQMRFAGKGQETLTHLATMIFDRDVQDETFEAVSKFYSLDLDILKADHKLFLHYKDKLEKQDMTAAEMFKKLSETNLIQLLPEFSKALKIFAVLPVSSCEAERSFSSLRRLKTYLRNTKPWDRSVSVV